MQGDEMSNRRSRSPLATSKTFSVVESPPTTRSSPLAPMEMELTLPSWRTDRVDLPNASWPFGAWAEKR
eukprot:6209596-Pleurochrysis_carterae.AAC.2